MGTWSCALGVSPSPKDEAEAKLSSEKADNSNCGIGEIFWETNWETRVIVIERLSRKG